MKLEDLDVTRLGPGDWLVIDGTKVTVEEVEGLMQEFPADLRERTVWLGIDHQVLRIP